MLRSASTSAELEPLRTRFQQVARQVTGGLGAISARVYELPEVRRPPLLALLLELESKQLQLRQFVEQIPLGAGADPRPLESAIRQQLELLAEVTTLAERVGLIERKAPPPRPRAAAATGSSIAPAYRNEFATALDRLGHAPQVPPRHGGPAERWDTTNGAAWPQPPPQPSGAYPPHVMPHPGLPAPPYYALPPHPAAYQHLPPAYYMPVPAAWPQFLQRAARSAELEEEEDEDEEAPRKRRRRRHEDEEPRRGASWSSLRNLGSIGLMLLAVGGVAVADRMYRHSGRGEKLVVAEHTTPEAETGEAAQSVIGKKFQGRLLVPSDGSEALGSARAPAPVDGPAPSPPEPPPRLAEQPTQRAAAMAPAAAETGARPAQRPVQARVAAVPAAPPQPVKLLAKAPAPAATPSAQVDAPAPPPKAKLAVAAPPAAAVKPSAAKPVPPPAEAEEEPSGGLFVPVLSTHKDAKAARDAFAELQKQHVAVLGAKQSEVQTSGSESGTWHRLVVTPASTKEAATELCNKLRAAGYARCWVKPY